MEKANKYNQLDKLSKLLSFTPKSRMRNTLKINYGIMHNDDNATVNELTTYVKSEDCLLNIYDFLHVLAYVCKYQVNLDSIENEDIYNCLSKIIFLPEDLLYITHVNMVYYDDKGDEFFVDFLESYWRNMSEEEALYEVIKLISKQ
jgi:hypothetical protein